MTTTKTSLDELFRARRNQVDFIDVPRLNYAMVMGSGAPADQSFADAIQALFSVSYGAHFGLKKERGISTHVLPLEALWCLEGPVWQWRAMIVQPDPIDETVVALAIQQARRKGVPALDRLRFESWEEGPCAQTLHIGPYGDEGATIERLHEAIAAAGYVLNGWHHEIYLGDPRRAAPEKLRTILRQPIAPA